MTYLVYDTQIDAQSALAQIWQNMRPIIEINAWTGQEVLPAITNGWAIERQRIDGKWVFVKPETDHMTNVGGYTEEEYSSEWFPVDVQQGGQI